MWKMFSHILPRYSEKSGSISQLINYYEGNSERQQYFLKKRASFLRILFESQTYLDNEMIKTGLFIG